MRRYRYEQVAAFVISWLLLGLVVLGIWKLGDLIW